MWKKLRVALLLFILVVVAADTYLTKYRSVSWDETLWVAVYPINPDNDPVVARYLDSLSSRNFEKVEEFFEREAQRVGLKLAQPFDIHLAHRVAEVPPAPPPTDANMLQVAWWSLKLRWFAWTRDESGFAPHIKMFVIYHDLNKVEKLAHSLGMDKGMIGVVHAYAHREMEGKNNLVLAHEILHTLGATDKYDYQTGEPIFPDGYAEPNRSPRFPQRYTELMGGRTPQSESESIMPRGLHSVLLGEKTLQEINWR